MKIRSSQRKTRKEKRVYKKRLFLRSFLFVFIFFFLLWFISKENFRISHFNIKGNKTVKMQDIEENINNILLDKILFIIPQNSIFTLSTKKIEKELENNFPKIYHASVVLNKNNSLHILIEERKPHSLWCKTKENRFLNTKKNIDKKNESGGDFDIFTDDVCYFADQKGYIYGEAPYFSDGVFQKIYLSKNLLQIGNQIFNEKEFSDFFIFINTLKDKYNINIDTIYISDTKMKNTQEVRIYISSLFKTFFQKDPYIIYKKGTDYSLVLNHIDLLFKESVFQKDFTEKPQLLSFIDLRIENQIRYKFTPKEE